MAAMEAAHASQINAMLTEAAAKAEAAQREIQTPAARLTQETGAGYVATLDGSPQAAACVKQTADTVSGCWASAPSLRVSPAARAAERAATKFC